MVDFEYPLPELSVETDGLMIETKAAYENSFKIKNTGGSVLSGKIFSRSRSIAFEPAAWEGNDVEIRYRFTPDAADGWKPGDAVETCAVISSNGGEKKLPITIRLTQMAIISEEGATIANIKDFYEYALTNPAQARKMFVDSEFYMLLLATGFEYMEAYEALHKDLNRERALDNFFILSGLKKKTGLTVPNRLVEFTRKPGDDNMVYGNFLIQKTDNGFCEASIAKQNNGEWLTLPAERVITSDFNEADTAMIKFSIDPLRVKGRYAREVITIGGSDSRARKEGDGIAAPSGVDAQAYVEVIFRRLQAVEFRLSREAYRFEDKGAVEIINNTGADLRVDLFCEDSFVRFAEKSYTVSERGEIPFTVKLSAFMTAQLMFRKMPFLRAAIEVSAVWRGKVVRRRLPFTVGEW